MLETPKNLPAVLTPEQGKQVKAKFNHKILCNLFKRSTVLAIGRVMAHLKDDANAYHVLHGLVAKIRKNIALDDL